MGGSGFRLDTGQGLFCVGRNLLRGGRRGEGMRGGGGWSASHWPILWNLPMRLAGPSGPCGFMGFASLPRLVGSPLVTCRAIALAWAISVKRRCFARAVPWMARPQGAGEWGCGERWALPRPARGYAPLDPAKGTSPSGLPSACGRGGGELLPGRNNGLQSG